MKRLLAFFLALTLCGQFLVVSPSPASALDLSVTSGDGMSLQFGNRGEVIFVRKGEQEITYKDIRDKSGFFVYDLKSDTDYAMRGQLQRVNDTVRLVGAKMEGYELNATFEPAKDHIVVRGTVTAEEGEDHAAKLSFRLPVDANGGNWWRDISTVQGVNEANIYNTVTTPYTLSEKTARTDERANIELSDYPFSALNMNGIGLSYGVTMDMPYVMRQHYDYKRGYMIEFDFGMSGETSAKYGVAPNTASFAFIIYHHDPKYGLRNAAQKYYEIFPQFFDTKIVAEKMGTIIEDETEITPDTAKKFQLGFVREPNVQNISTYLQEGTYRLRSGECYNTWIPNQEVPKEAVTNVAFFSEDEVRNLLWSLKDSLDLNPEFGNRPYNQFMSSLLFSMAQSPQSKLQVKLGEQPFMYKKTMYGEKPLVHVAFNCGSTLPEPNMGTMMYDTFFADVAKGGTKTKDFDGVYVGQLTLGSHEGGDPYNFRRDHFPYSPMPLVYEKKQGRLATLMTYGNIDFLKTIKERMHDAGKIVLGDLNVEVRENVLWWYAPYLDALGGKFAYLWPQTTVEQMDSAKYMTMLRTLSGKKPIYTIYAPRDDANYKEYLELSLFYGSYPNVQELGKAKFAENAELASWPEYLEMIQTLNTAGWKPVNFVNRNDGVYKVERFGDEKKGEVYLTLYNTREVKRAAAVGIDLNDMGVDKITVLQDVRTKREYTPTVVGSTLMLEYEGDGHATQVYKIVFTPKQGVVETEEPVVTPEETTPEEEPVVTEEAQGEQTLRTYTGQGVTFTYPEHWGTPKVQEVPAVKEEAGKVLKITFATETRIEGMLITKDAVRGEQFLYTGSTSPMMMCALLTKDKNLCTEETFGKQKGVSFAHEGIYGWEKAGLHLLVTPTSGNWTGAQWVYTGTDEETKKQLRTMVSSFGGVAQVFSDLPSTHPKSTAILALKELGIVSGYADGTFKPDNIVNRAEMLKIIMESLKVPTQVPTTPCFSDVPVDAWFSKYVCTAKLLGWVEGYPDDVNVGQRKFVPWQEIRRGEALKMVGVMKRWNLADALSAEVFPGPGMEDQSLWYMPYVKYAKLKKYIEADSDGTYIPWNTVSRGEMSDLLYRMVK